MNEHLKVYTTKEIGNWLKNSNEITLPSLQRGFVWKTHQIEALWDSIFRGYPIGAILMSVGDDNKKELLDGQQRCTSIALGYYNPFETKEINSFLSLKDYLPSIWVDLKPQQLTKGQKFVFRVLTKSHPWGYQLFDNSKVLEMKDRKEFLKPFQKDNQDFKYTNISSVDIFPWDAYCPVPLAVLLEINADLPSHEFVSELKDKIGSLKMHTKHGYVDYNSLSEDDLEKFREALKNVADLKLPEILVKSSVLKEENSSETESQDPTLFVRLNANGTRITGEELIYSIYKASFSDAKNLVELIGASYIAPSRLISLFARLVKCENDKYSSFPSEFNPNSFKNELTKSKDFKEKLEDYITVKNGNSEAKAIFDTAIKILEQKDSETPAAYVKQLVNSNPNLFLVLLMYIKRNNLHKTDLEVKIIKDISSSYTHLLWFIYDNSTVKPKDVVVEFFKQLNKSDQLSWNEACNSEDIKKHLIPLPEPSIIKAALLKITLSIGCYFWEIEKFKNEMPELNAYFDVSQELSLLKWVNFIGKIRSNKSFLIFAQRAYMNAKFKDFNQYEGIEDTNRPWDWDHIYPHSWVYNKEGINKLVKDWLNTNGNFRALSYDDNRSENNRSSPAQRLKTDSKKEDSFIKEDDFQEWSKLKDSRLKEGEQVSFFLSATIKRMVNIYEEWYRNYYL